MKKLIVVFIGMLLCVSLFAALELVSNSSVSINGVFYNCSSTGHSLDFSGDIGSLGHLTLGGKCNVKEDTQRLGIGTVTCKMWYSFNAADWTDIAMSAGTAFEGEGVKITEYSASGQSVDISGLSNGSSNTLYIYFKATQSTTTKTDPITNPTTDPYEATFTKIADISFTDGSSFTPDAPTKGNTEQVIGRFWLSADVSGATLTDASIEIDGTRTGMSNFKLWSSADDTFDGGDTQLGNTVAIDPGGSPADFTSFTSAISTSGTYYFVTVDVASDATGAIQGVVVENSDLTISSGALSGTIDNAVLSGSETATPITLTSFLAEANNGVVELSWKTASETENAHFLIYRDGDVIAQIAGAGTTTEPHDYTYTDALVEAGKVYEYALADVTWGGEINLHDPVMVEMGANIAEADFILEAAYPNPFNPKTVISMQYAPLRQGYAGQAAGSKVEVNIYDTNGTLVEELVNGYVEAGNYKVTWNAVNMPSGMYIVRMMAGNSIQSQKIVLMK